MSYRKSNTSAVSSAAKYPTLGALVVAAFYVRGERERAACFQKYTRAPHTEKSRGMSTRLANRTAASITRSCLLQGVAGRSSPMCRLGHETQLLSTPSPKRRKNVAVFGGKKLRVKSVFLGLAFHTNFAQTQLLTQLHQSTEHVGKNLLALCNSSNSVKCALLSFLVRLAIVC